MGGSKEVPVRPFRFGVVAMARGGGRAWRDAVARIAGLGYGSVLMPEVAGMASPVPALAVAATATDLRVGTFVSASPLRAAGSSAWEAHSLTELTDGRFEFGIGTGLPQAGAKGAELLGTPELSPRERLDRVEETLSRLRELDGGRRTPVLVAAGGPRARSLAAREADIVTLATSPTTSVAELAELTADVRDRAGERAGEIEFATNLFVVGEEIPPEIRPWVGADLDSLVAHDSTSLLRGDPDAMAEELTARRARTGVSYVLVNQVFAEALAPVVARLIGT